MYMYIYESLYSKGGEFGNSYLQTMHVEEEGGVGIIGSLIHLKGYLNVHDRFTKFS